ncbi:hypothetical protein HZA87_02120 [Candidatus Uhrbacteria bacterium]|nr:hypothetical protein [Candidatus Uhrbacteria bacterium]
MFLVRFSEAAVTEMLIYVDAYRRGYRELFSDTGIWFEKIILEQYELSAQSLFDSLFLSIKQLLRPSKVLGRSHSVKLSECHFYLGDRLVIISYTENAKKKERTVQSININRKSILF